MLRAGTWSLAVQGDFGERKTVDNLGVRLFGKRAGQDVGDGADQDLAARGPERRDRLLFRVRGSAHCSVGFARRNMFMNNGVASGMTPGCWSGRIRLAERDGLGGNAKLVRHEFPPLDRIAGL